MRPAKNRGGLEEPPSRGRVRTRGAGPRTGVQTREQLEDAACTKVEAPPDTRRHEVLVLRKQGSPTRGGSEQPELDDAKTMIPRRVCSPKSGPPHRAPGAPKDAPLCVAGTTPVRDKPASQPGLGRTDTPPPRAPGAPHGRASGLSRPGTPKARYSPVIRPIGHPWAE